MLKTYLLLIYEFFKTGLFSIGGGLATIPFLYEIAEKYTWFTTEDVATFIAISESTPGPIGINMATYAGYKAIGISGGVVATLALVLPSVIITLIIAKALRDFDQNRWVQGGLYGLKAVVIGLFFSAAWNVIRITLFTITDTSFIFNWKQIVMFICLFLVTLKWKKMNPVLIIAISAALGLIFAL